MITLQIKNEDQFKKALSDAARKAGDLTVPLKEMAADWFVTNQPIFSSRRLAGWPDLKDKTKDKKKTKYGYIYPLLEATGRLRASITDPTSPDAIDLLVNKKNIKVGTRVPYGIYHQQGGSKIPQRKFVFITNSPGAPAIAQTIGEKRIKRWKGFLKSYLVAKTKEELGRG